MSETLNFDPNKELGDSHAFRNRSRSGSSFNDPNELDYKSLKPGDYVDIRFLDMSEDAFVEIPCRRVGKRNPKNGQQMSIVIQDLGVEAFKGMVDNYGNPINEAKKTFLYRLPVWVEGYGVTASDGTVEYTVVNSLKYIEFGPGLSKSLDELEKAQNGVGAFDEKTGLPHYDVRLNIVNGPSKEIPKNYEFEPIMVDPKTKKVIDTFGKGIKERFSAEQLEYIKEAWGEVIQAMRKRETLDDVKRNLDGSKKEGGKSLSVRVGENADYNID